MKLTLFVVSVFLVLSIFSATQTDKGPPNLAGTWKLKGSKDTWAGSRIRREIGNRLVITQTENELTFVGTYFLQGVEQTNHLTFYTDGRGEENLWAGSKRPVKTVTTWDNGVLKILEIMKATFRGPYGVKKADLKLEEEWKLSEDGKELAQRVRNNWAEVDPMGGGTEAYPKEVKHVYERQP